MNSSAVENPHFSRVMTSFLEHLNRSPQIDPNDLVFTPLKGGKSNARLYHFEINGTSYVVRFLADQANELARKHEIALAEQAGKIGIGPKVYFVDYAMNAIITEFIFGRTVLQSDFEKSSQLKEFAQILQNLHNSKEYFPVADCPFSRFSHFLSHGEKNGTVYPSQLLEVKTVMKKIQTVLQSHPVAQVPCHLDLHPFNIMRSEDRFFLVDWVNGGISDPYFDLATFTTNQQLDELKTREFLTHYFTKAPSHDQWNRFIITQPVRYFVITAAVLSLFQKPHNVSYEEAFKSLTLVPMTDFMKEEQNDSLWLFGVKMLLEGLTLIKKEAFRKTLLNYTTSLHL